MYVKRWHIAACLQTVRVRWTWRQWTGPWERVTCWRVHLMVTLSPATSGLTLTGWSCPLVLRWRSPVIIRRWLARPAATLPRLAVRPRPLTSSPTVYFLSLSLSLIPGSPPQSVAINYLTPRPRSKFGDRAFSYAGPAVRNRLTARNNPPSSDTNTSKNVKKI